MHSYHYAICVHIRPGYCYVTYSRKGIEYSNVYELCCTDTLILRN